MHTSFVTAFLALLCIMPALAADATAPVETMASSSAPPGNSEQIEQELQRLPWRQFRSVVEAVPKLKAEVAAYGALGWSFVQANYQSYPWKKKIDRLDAAQRRHLVELIQLAKQGALADEPSSKP